MSEATPVAAPSVEQDCSVETESAERTSATETVPPVANGGVARRHDLDALRAVAMLLGIVLHVALSFAPMPWIVQDSKQHWAFSILIDVTHGFRMPLFFLISGFFTAMLIEKRGIWKTAKHRFMRIFLPLVLGCFTVIPLMNAVSARAMKALWGGEAKVNDASVNAEDQTAGNNALVGAGRALFDFFATDIFTAARTGNVDAINKVIAKSTAENEIDLERKGPTYKLTALHLASLFGHAEAVRVLAEAGANVSPTADDGGTPLHVAAFFGYDDVVEVLLENGANPHVQNGRGETARDTLAAGWEITRVIADVIQVPVKRGEVEAGRSVIEPMLVEAEASVAPPIDDRTGLERYQAMVARPIFSMPVVHHLWFLSFLCWLCVALFVLVGVGRVLGVRSLPRWPVLSPASYLWVIPLTLLPQSLMKNGEVMFGPDTSAGVLPMPHTLFYYGLFFLFGAWYWTCRDSADAKDAKLGRYWWVGLPIALFVVYPLGRDFMSNSFEWRGHLLPEEWFEPAAQLAKAIYAWMMSIACVGLFRWMLSKKNVVVRYISDSSYWLYVAHLPLVIWLQFYVRAWDAPIVVKFLVVCGLTTASLLISYQLLVRHTPIGWLLNGRRRPATSSQ